MFSKLKPVNINFRELLKKLFSSKKFYIVIAIALLLIVAGTALWMINAQYRKLEVFTEVTYLSPTEALIFWKTENESVGYINVGKTKFNRDKSISQTSSEANQIHVVYVDGIGPDGLYYSKHTDKDSFLIIPKVEKLKYIEESVE